MKFVGITKKRDKKINYLFAVLAAYMLYLEILRHQWVYIPVILLVILACFFEKDHVICDEGVDIEYRLFGIKVHNLWKWDAITTIHMDYKKAFPNVMVHIGKDIVTRTFIFQREQCGDIAALAKKKNSKIYIEQ